MIQSMPIAQVRKDLSQLPDVFAAEPQPSALAVTRRGQPVLALMPWALYQGGDGLSVEPETRPQLS